MISLLERVGRQRQDNGITEYLLVPALPSPQLFGSLYGVVLLAACCRFRRERPYVVACVNEARLQERSQPEDVAYVRSLPSLAFSKGEGATRMIYAGHGDISPLLPESEDGFLLLLAEPNIVSLPPWPQMVTQTNGVLIGRTDELITLQTKDPQVEVMIDGMPDHRFGNDPWCSTWP